MPKATREQFLECLEQSWQPYITQFYNLPLAEQQAFLQKQGYANLHDLLAHVIAWWQDGAAVIAKLQADPALPLPEYDVDAFNAAAVKKFEPIGHDEIIQAYQSQRQIMANLVRNLPEAEINYDNVNLRLKYEILLHWTEHELN